MEGWEEGGGWGEVEEGVCGGGEQLIGICKTCGESRGRKCLFVQ